ncbi:hypothetical protein RMATCC62417_04398 [Rhizopus microsporus]|nr:hypothetical protein RMATCC62417_04398 [Rhizopus microsporus]
MTCKSNGIKLAQNITLLPGIKTTRLLGTKDTVSDSSKKKGPASYELTDHSTVKEESKKPKETLVQEIQGLQSEVVQIEKLLKDALKNNNNRSFSKDIKDLKAKWRNNSLEEKVDLYNAIEQVKNERNQSFLSVQAARDKLKLKRQLMHFKRVAMRQKPAITHETATASQSSNTQWHVVQKYGHGIAKVEDCRLSPQANPSEEFVFSSTNNGLKTMTSTVPLKMKRFKFHLELRNKYKALENTDECKEEAQKIVSKYSSEESDAKSFLQLPSSMAIKAGDMDIGSGYYNVRRKLEKAKKSTEGKAVQAIENNLAKLDLKMATSVEQAMNIHQQHVSNRLALRNFYNSKESQIEMQNDRFRRRLCAKERTFLIGKKVKGRSRPCPIMFIGDRGTGVGSTIKGYRRYGGKWKQCIHGMNINVCITNENMTSQTCMYCFSKLDHPIHRKKINDKEIKTNVKALFLCRNPDCVLVLNKKAIKSRDSLSALAIGLDANNRGKSSCDFLIAVAI